jgi:tRNA (guanine-N7-)-methyltransferase
MSLAPDRRPVGGSYTFGGRQGRMSPTRQRWFDELVPRYAVDRETDLVALINGRRLIVEIGCGKGHATAAMAPGDGDALVIACEPNDATCAHLASLLDTAEVTNVRLWIGDAFDLLAALPPASVSEIRAWFPDPWPKPRHAHKRLITPLRIGVIVDALMPGGVLRLASDAVDYAAEALSAIANEPRLSGGVVERPVERPVTVFEARGHREGRTATDMQAVRVADLQQL